MANKKNPSLLRLLRFTALAAALLGSGKLITIGIFYNNAFTTQGIVLDFAATDELFSPQTTPVIAYIDYRDQKQLATPGSALGSEDMFLGQKVRIRYDGSRPELFRLDTPLGMWGEGVLRILFGLVPFILLSILIAKTKRPSARLARPTAQARLSGIKGKHLIRHKNPPPDKGVVRRMR